LKSKKKNRFREAPKDLLYRRARMEGPIVKGAEDEEELGKPTALGEKKTVAENHSAESGRGGDCQKEREEKKNPFHKEVRRSRGST